MRKRFENDKSDGRWYSRRMELLRKHNTGS